MFKKLRSKVKGALVQSAVVVGSTTVLVAFLFGIDALSLSFGEIITVLGIWLMIGVLLGQNKPSDMGLREYINRRGLSVGASWLVFSLIGLVYMIREDQNIGGDAVIGLLILSIVGLAVGFVAGMDREPGK